jgi:tetratricopeptide (TPR) repeat protein
LCVGALAGYTTGSEIRDVRVSGEIAGDTAVGGITGYASDYNGLQSQIIRCSAEVVIEPANSTSDYLGGIVGCLTNSLVSQCFTRVNIEGRYYLGGVVGYSYIAEITDCQSEGRVFGNDISVCVGGILGLGGSTTISDCSSVAYNVTGDQKVGGIAGNLYNNCAVNNCVNAVTLTGSTSYDEAIKEYRRTLKIKPEHDYAKWFLSKALMAKGYNDEAFWLVRDLIIKHKNRPELYEYAGEILIKLDQINAAKEYFAKCEELLYNKKDGEISVKSLTKPNMGDWEKYFF